MVDLQEYDQAIAEENTAKNFASVVFLFLAILSFLAYIFVNEPIITIPESTLKIIFGFTAILLFSGGIYIRFIHVQKADDDF